MAKLLGIVRKLNSEVTGFMEERVLELSVIVKKHVNEEFVVWKSNNVIMWVRLFLKSSFIYIYIKKIKTNKGCDSEVLCDWKRNGGRNELKTPPLAQVWSLYGYKITWNEFVGMLWQQDPWSIRVRDGNLSFSINLFFFLWILISWWYKTTSM